MNARPLRWEDLKINNAHTWRTGEKSVWKNRAGETKVHASLKNCGFVNTLMWIKDFSEENPVHRAMVLLQMTRSLVARLNNLKDYTTEMPPDDYSI